MNRSERWVLMSALTALLGLGGFSGCSGSSTGTGSTDTVTDTAAEAAAKAVADVKTYRDGSQCTKIGGATTKGLTLPTTITALTTQDLDKLKAEFQGLLGNLQRVITDKTKTLSLSAAVQQSIQGARQALTTARPLYQQLTANATSTPYPVANFTSETAPMHGEVGNQNFFDRLDMAVHQRLADGRVALRFSFTNTEGVAYDTITPDHCLLEGLDDQGVKVHDFTEFEFSNILAELTATGKALTVSTVNDYSGSMKNDLDHVETALKVFYTLYPDTFQTEIVKFTRKTMVFYPLATAAGAVFQTAITARPNLGATAIYDAVTVGVTDVCQGTGYKALLLLTDGQDNSSQVSLDETIAFAQANNVPIFVIGFGYANKTVLARLASETGGVYLYFPYDVYKQFANGPADTAYKLIGNLLNYTYLITPKTIPSNVKTIQLSVQVGDAVKAVKVGL